MDYTPAIHYSRDLDRKLMGAFEGDLDNVPFDYQGNHIQYIKKSTVDRVLQYDNTGVEMAKKYAYGGSYTRLVS